MGDTVNDLLDNLTDAMLAREDSCHGLARPHERDRAVTQWHNAVSAIHEALTREPLPTGTAGVGEPVSDAYKLPRVVEALIAAAEAYEKKFGHFQDYRLSMRDDAFPTDKVERAVVVAVRQYRAALAVAAAPTASGEVPEVGFGNPTGTAGVVTEAMHDAAFRAYADQRFTFGVFEMTAADEHRIREALRKAVDAAFAALAAATGMGEQSDA